jgi:hypothetical protein
MRLHAERGQCLKNRLRLVARKTAIGPPGCHFPHQREIIFDIRGNFLKRRVA